MSKSDAEIEQKALELFKPLAVYDFYQDHVSVEVRRNDGTVLVEVGCFYESPKQDETVLEQFRKFLGLKHIDVHYDISESGCDTCDYGSRYGYAVRAWN